MRCRHHRWHLLYLPYYCNLTPLGQQRRGAERTRWLRMNGHSNAQRCPIFIADTDMMTQGFYQSNAGAGFREYLTSSMSDIFSLDLSKCTLIECITKMCEIKSRSHPKIKQNYRMLVNTLRNIPRNKILRATGHSSEKAFNRYICYDEEN